MGDGSPWVTREPREAKVAKVALGIPKLTHDSLMLHQGFMMISWVKLGKAGSAMVMARLQMVADHHWEAATQRPRWRLFAR